MTASYVSVRFEKTDLSATIGKQRCIVRTRNDGPIPPLPSLGYYPTAPNELMAPLVCEYIDDVLGERMSRVATLADLTGLPISTLTLFEDLTVDFVAAGVAPGDVLEVVSVVSSEWSSEEYPGTSFQFAVAGVLSPTQLSVSKAFPSFKANMSWEIAAIGLAGNGGVTRRAGAPATFLETRFNALFNSVPELDAFVEATKAGLDALGTTSTSSTLTSENYTSQV